MVSVGVGELRLGLVRLLGGVLWSHEDRRDAQHGHDAHDLVGALELRAREEHLAMLGRQRELRHPPAQLGQVALVVERAEVVEELERAHERLRRRRVHKVKVHEVVDAELL